MVEVLFESVDGCKKQGCRTRPVQASSQHALLWNSLYRSCLHSIGCRGYRVRGVALAIGITLSLYVLIRETVLMS